jgi:hypothetical protein
MYEGSGIAHGPVSLEIDRLILKLRKGESLCESLSKPCLN